MIDLHAHVLPGIDDGPGDLDGCVALAAAAAATGTTTIAATSHIDHAFSVDPAVLAPLRAEVAARLREEGVPVEIIPGAEIALSRLLELDEETLVALRLGSGRFLLIEAPLSPAAPDMEPVVRDLRRRGHEVLLGHPERCPALIRDPARVHGLVEAGACVQITAGSLRGQFGQTVRRCSLDLLARGLVHCVASDAHDATHRPPGLADALEDLGAGHLVPALCVDGPAAIAGGEIPDPAPAFAIEKRRRFLGLF